MPKVLYNKYRSSDFDQLIGQEHVSRILKNSVKSGKISHAYLFVGSRGTGKTSTARILSKALNCTNLKPDGNPCNECQSCTQINQGRFLDLIEIDAASNRGIDQIRELKEKLEFSPVEGKFKIYIIDEVHMLTKEAFNALLKTLEEPPQHVIFMLATTDVHKLPPTILSRCQRYDMKLGTNDEIKRVLKGVSKNEGISLEDKALEILIAGAKGSYRDALSLLDAVISGQMTSEKPEIVTEAEVRKVLGIPDSTMVYTFLETLVNVDGKKALELISQLENKGVNLPQFLKYNLDMLQDILIKKIANTWDMNEYEFANNLSVTQISSIISHFLLAERNIKTTSNSSLILDMLIVQISSLSLNTTKKLGKEVKQLNKEETEDKIGDKTFVEKPNVKVEVEVEVKSDATKAVKSNEEEEEEETMVEIEDETVSKGSKNITFSDIQKEWDRVIQSLKSSSGHLCAFLGSSKLIDYANQTLKLEVPFEFHKERIESVSSRDSIGKVLNNIFGTSFKVECIVNGNFVKKKRASADIVMQNIPPKTTQAVQVENKPTSQPRKISKKIEEIFEGM